jgi:hypothetical protein
MGGGAVALSSAIPSTVSTSTLPSNNSVTNIDSASQKIPAVSTAPTVEFKQIKNALAQKFPQFTEAELLSRFNALSIPADVGFIEQAKKRTGVNIEIAALENPAQEGYYDRAKNTIVLSQSATQYRQAGIEIDDSGAAREIVAEYVRTHCF